MTQAVIAQSSDVMGGKVVFYGTRVPVQTLLDYLEAGETIDDFLAGFPSVTRAQVIAFLEAAKDRLAESAAQMNRTPCQRALKLAKKPGNGTPMEWHRPKSQRP